MVLDASAVLAVLLEEPGADAALAGMRSGLLSTVNIVEVIEKGQRAGIDPERLFRLLGRLEVVIVPFELPEARTAAEFKADPQCKGLSLADRSCLALAKRRALPVLTGDRIWAGLDLGIDIRLIR